MDSLMEETRPVYDHRSMVLMVRDALLDRKELQLQVADVTSLIASVTTPSPPVTDWTEYLGWCAEAGLPDAVFACASESDNEDVVLFVFYCLQQWLEKEVARASAEIVALHRLPSTLVALMKRHARNPILLDKGLSILCVLPDEVLGSEQHGKALVMDLIGGLEDLLESAHTHGTHQQWLVVTTALRRLLSIVSFRAAAWGLGPAVVDAHVARLLAAAAMNAQHWQVVHVLSLVMPFTRSLVRNASVASSCCVRVMLAHTRDGMECTDRGACDTEYSRTSGWGATLDACLNILAVLCAAEADQPRVPTEVFVAARARLNPYVVGRKLEATSRLHLAAPAQLEMLCRGSCVRACVEVLMSHPDYLQLVRKALDVLMMLSFVSPSPHFALAELYRDGAGAFVLIQRMAAGSDGGGPTTADAAAVDDGMRDNAAALLTLLATQEPYKLGVLGRAYESLWNATLNPATMVRGLAVLCQLALGGGEACDWMRRHKVDEHVATLYREQTLELPVFKMAVDVLAEMRSPLLDALPTEVGVAPLVSLLFYFTPGLSDTELTRDCSTLLCALLRALTDAMVRADAEAPAGTANSSTLTLALLDAGYAMTLVQMLWHLEPDSEVWKQAVLAAHQFFRWEAETPLASAHKWLLHVRRTAEDLDPSAKQFRKVLERTPSLTPETYSGPRNSFWEGLFVPAMQKRKIVVRPSYSAPPRNDYLVRSHTATGRVTAQTVDPYAAYHQRVQQQQQQHQQKQHANANLRECAFCGRVPSTMGDKLLRCGRCHKLAYCKADCQRNHWPQHKKECK